MIEELVFGWRTAVLTVPIIIMASVAIALTQPLRNRLANRVLGALLIVLIGMCTPWAIGFAGFYDAFPWLSFAPFANSLAIPVFIFFYLHALVTGRLPDHAWRHLAAPLAQFGYQSICFMLPLSLKDSWSDLSADAYQATTSLLFAAMCAGYGYQGNRLLGRYRESLKETRSDDERFAALWLERALIGTAILLAIWALFEIRDWIEPLGYSGLMGLYIAIATFGTFLAFEGWRHANLPFPHIATKEPSEEPVTETPNTRERKDWASLGKDIARQVSEREIYRDPELSIQQLARSLGTNQTYVSRALNEGLGQNFSALINSLRSEHAAREMTKDAAPDLLSIALEAGFNSKASFHRAFRARFEMTPTEYRQAKSQKQ